MRTPLALVTVVALSSGCYHRHTLDLARLPTEWQEDGAPVEVWTTGEERLDVRDDEVDVRVGEARPERLRVSGLWSADETVWLLTTRGSDGPRLFPLDTTRIERDELDAGLTALAIVLPFAIVGALVGAVALGLGSCGCVAIQIGVW